MLMVVGLFLLSLVCSLIYMKYNKMALEFVFFAAVEVDESLGNLEIPSERL